MFTELTRRRFQKLKKIRRAYFSLLILLFAFFLSLFSELLANDKPYFFRYNENWYFPIFKFYPETEFGGKYKTEPDYRHLRNDGIFQSNSSFLFFPPIPHHPLRSNLESEGAPPYAPSSVHWLGTDSIGRDVLSRLLYGFRICMVFALSLVLLVSVMGIAAGGIQGYFGGKTDLFGQRLIEIWSSLPFLYVVILLGSIYGRSFSLLLAVVAIFSWMGLSYYMRGEFYRLKNLNYIKNAQALGYGHFRIFLRHILPNGLTPVVTLLPFILISGIGALTSLDFLGFGLQPPTPSWGEMLSQGLNYLYAPWIALSAVSALFITLLLSNFVGEGVREAFDPKVGDK